MEYQGKKITVVGLGKSGYAAALFLKDQGAVVCVTDNSNNPDIDENAKSLSDKGVQVEVDTHSESLIKDSELIVVSPGVSNESDAIRWAEEKDIPIISEIELAYSFCKPPVIAITGTNGKSTVTALVGEILKAGGKRAVVCGNIGLPFCSEVLNLDENSVAVLEISSYQLERIKGFRPKVSCLLNVTQDHFDRYRGIDEYFQAKKRIFLNQTEDDHAVLNFDSHKIRALKSSLPAKPLFFSKYSLSKEYDGAYVENDQIVIRINNKFIWVSGVEELSLGGSHNLQNCLASALTCFLFGVSADTIREVLINFKTLPHRFETVDTIKGVRYIDDSKATNVDSVVNALDCCKSSVFLIAGGRDKESDYKALIKPVKEKVKALILLGEAKEKIADCLSSVKPVHFADDINKAVGLAFEKASRGDTVLLSPICSSFDMFKDYKERGEVFRKAVLALK